MQPGLKIVVLAGTRWYNLTLVGWMRRVGGDEWELLPGARVILRTNGNYDWNGIDTLAADGPTENYQIGEPMRTPETVHRLLVRRVKAANEKAWAKECPRPKDWSDEQ